MAFESDTSRVTVRLHPAFARMRARLAGEQGFTLVELTIVLLILGILLTIAVPSYMSLKDKANKTAAAADLKQAAKAVIA